MTEYLEKAALVRILRAKAEMGRLSEYSVCFDNVAKMLPTGARFQNRLRRISYDKF